VLAHSSPHFFAQPPAGNANQSQVAKKMPEYLDMMVKKLIDEKAVSELLVLHLLL
jgi:hypothetical protein